MNQDWLVLEGSLDNKVQLDLMVKEENLEVPDQLDRLETEDKEENLEQQD